MMIWFFAVVFATGGFFIGFMTCFMCYSNKSLKTMYSNARDRYEALRDQFRWHAYPDEKPLIGQLCAVLSPGNVLGYGALNESGDGWEGPEGAVTHWMPLPKPPEE